jgi:hypothetical protein
MINTPGGLSLATMSVVEMQFHILQRSTTTTLPRGAATATPIELVVSNGRTSICDRRCRFPISTDKLWQI